MTCFNTLKAALLHPPNWLIMSSLAFVQIGFGGYSIILKQFAQDANVNPVVLSLLRDGCCFPLMILAAYLIEGKTSPGWRDMLLFWFLGALGMFGNQLLFILGVYYTSSNIASLFQPAIPVFTSLLSILTKTEPFPPLNHLYGVARVLGILCATGGAITMIAGKGLGSDTSDASSTDLLIGNMFLLGNTIAMSFYILCQKRFIFAPGARFHQWSAYPVTVTAWAYLSGTACMGLASLYYVGKQEYDIFELPTEAVVPVVYAVLISSALCFGVLTWANKHAPSTLVTAFWPVQVPVTVILSYAVFNDSLEAVQYVGGGLIIVGLLSVAWSYYKQGQIEKDMSDTQLGFSNSSSYNNNSHNYNNSIESSETVFNNETIQDEQKRRLL